MSTESTGRSPARRILALAGALAVTALVIVGEWVNADDPSAGPSGVTAVIAVAFTTMGALILVSQPGHLVGRLMLAAGGAASVAVLAVSWTSWLPLAWLSQWAWWPAYGLIFLALLVFPDGRLPSPRWRPLAVVIVGATVIATIAYAVAALDDPRTLLSAAQPASTLRARVLVMVALGAVTVSVLGLVGVLVSMLVRWRRANGDARAQLACLLAAGILLLLGVMLETLGLPGAWVIRVVAVPIGMAIAVLRYQLYGLDQIINRTIVWLVMSLLVIAGFVGLIALLRDVLMSGDTSNASLVATGLIAVAFEPARHRVQRGVNRLLYGDRDDPYKVIARLGDLLGRTVEPGAVLPLLTDTIAHSLRVPHVAVEIEGREGPRVLASHGTASTAVESFDMVTRGERVGRLLVATRSPGSRFTPVERRLLNDLALQAAVAADATRLIRDLQDSRERLILAREEERRRLRRDLHDGLGPTLAGMSMQVRAAKKLVAEQPRAGRILDALADDLQTCTVEVRQLVNQLRPPALDRGLAAALRTECARFEGPTLAIRLKVEGNLPGLPAAIEVAAYRIVAEALTNVVRHAEASTCWITVRWDRSLTLEIIDDGVGVGARRPGGVGLDSMRERATELGGEFDIAAAVPRGTSIRVRLPSQPGPTAERRAPGDEAVTARPATGEATVEQHHAAAAQPEPPASTDQPEATVEQPVPGPTTINQPVPDRVACETTGAAGRPDARVGAQASGARVPAARPPGAGRAETGPVGGTAGPTPDGGAAGTG